MRWSYSDEEKGFTIDAKTNILKGDEIYDNYGTKCNSRFFLNYGLIV